MNDESTLEQLFKQENKNKFSFQLIFWSFAVFLISLTLVVFNSEIKENPISLIHVFILPLFISFILSKISLIFITMNQVEFMSEYKKNLANTLNEISFLNISEVISSKKIKNQFKKLKSIPQTRTKLFEDFLNINGSYYFESEIYSQGEKGKKNNCHRYSCLAIKNRNRSRFHIISRKSSFISTREIKYHKRLSDVSTALYKKIWQYLSTIINPVFSFLYFPVNKYLEITNAWNKAKEAVKKSNFHSDNESTPISFLIIGSYLFYTIFLWIIFKIFIFEYIVFELFLFILIPTVFVVAFIPMLLSLIYSIFTINKATIDYKDIDVDNESFNKIFDVHTTNEVDSDTFLSPRNMEKILLLDNKNHISIETSPDFIFVIMEKRKNMFEFKKVKKFEELVAIHLAELEEIIKIKESLDFK